MPKRSTGMSSTLSTGPTGATRPTGATTTPSTGSGLAVLARHTQVALGVAGAIAAAYLVSVIVRPVGSYDALVDGWGASAFELVMGALCIRRFFDPKWRSGSSAARALPLVLGAACIMWAVGDVALTAESMGGATPPVPSAADAFYLGFYPLCFVGFMMVIRRGNSGSLVATSLDGLVAGLGVASFSAAYAFHSVMTATGAGALATATNMAFPVGDLLLLAIAVGGITILPKGYRPFLVIAGIAMVANATGDMFNLLQPSSRLGYVTNAIAWPVSLLMLAVAVWVQPTKVTARVTDAQKASTEKTAGFMVPAFGMAAGLIVLVAATFGHIERLAVGIATLTLVVAALRLGLSVRAARTLNSARFRSLVDNAWDLIVVTETDLRIAYVTPSSQRMLDYAPGILQGTVISDIFHPDDAGVIVGHLKDLGRGRAGSGTFETRVRRGDGAWRTISWTATDLIDDPSVRGYVFNGSDVTEVRHALGDLATARDGALSASKAKSAFLSTMSHEIRTPMNGVIGLADLLLETDLDPNQRELASGVQVAAESLLVIINDILDFSKIEAGKLEIEEALLDVRALADDVGRILAQTAHAKGIELLIDVHPDVPAALLGDAVRIQQVLLNLGSNAVKFSLEEEVVIRVSVLHQNPERVALRFDVVDLGIGIAAQDQERLFRAFAQADSSTTRKFGGTGLGLAICRQLVELMGGTLGLVSAPGQGSTFWFELSLPRAEELAPSEDADDHRDLVGLRALIVDDNATNRKILRLQLTSLGARGRRGGRRLRGPGSGGGGGGAPGVRPGGDRPQHAGDGRHGARLPPEGGPVHGGDAAVLVELVGRPPGSGRVPPPGLRRELDQARPLLGIVRPPDHHAPRGHTGRHVGTAAQRGAPRSHDGEEDEGPDEGAVKGLVLLVDDNVTNQLVGSKVLASLGYRFDIAGNGAEAVAAVRRGRYDAILMDCQMPEMDGYEATDEIRLLEGAEHHTPIIAMTAAAMDGDREKCLGAGMDDYITKPVRSAVVASALERWLAGAGAEEPAHRAAPEEPAHRAAPEEPDTSSPDAPTGPLDEVQIELLRSLDDGQGSVLGEVVDQYLGQTAAGRDELVGLLAAGDAAAARRAAHMLKGASANIGAVVLASICAEIETTEDLEAGDKGNRLVERFDAELARVHQALVALRDRELPCAS